MLARNVLKSMKKIALYDEVTLPVVIIRDDMYTEEAFLKSLGERLELRKVSKVTLNHWPAVYMTYREVRDLLCFLSDYTTCPVHLDFTAQHDLWIGKFYEHAENYLKPLSKKPALICEVDSDNQFGWPVMFQTLCAVKRVVTWKSTLLSGPTLFMPKGIRASSNPDFHHAFVKNASIPYVPTIRTTSLCSLWESEEQLSTSPPSNGFNK